MALVWAIADGAKTAKNIAASNLQISASTSEISCPTGQVVYGINNYPFTSSPTESGAHKTYTDKMTDGKWKCSAVCAPSDTNQFADFLANLKINGKDANIVADKAAFDTLVNSLSGKSEILDRTIILENTLLRKNVGCFGPSEDYKNLTGATIAKENTTIQDQQAAEKAATSATATKTNTPQTAAQDNGGEGDTFKVPSTGENSSSSVNKTATKTASADAAAARSKSKNYSELKKCWLRTRSLFSAYGLDSPEEAEKFLDDSSRKELNNKFISVYKQYSTLSNSKTWGVREEKWTAQTLNACNSFSIKLLESLREAYPKDTTTPSTQETEQRSSTVSELKITGRLYYSKGRISKRGKVCIALLPNNGSTVEGTTFNSCSAASDGYFSLSLRLKTDDLSNFQSVFVYAVDLGGLKSARNQAYVRSIWTTLNGTKEARSEIDMGDITLNQEYYISDTATAQSLAANRLKEIATKNLGFDCLRSFN